MVDLFDCFIGNTLLVRSIIVSGEIGEETNADRSPCAVKAACPVKARYKAEK